MDRDGAPAFPAAPLAPRIPQAGRAPAPAPAAPTAASAEPVIHVTIGRIEVRAAPAPKGASRERQAAPPVALDEYLRQRARGEGR